MENDLAIEGKRKRFSSWDEDEDEDEEDDADVDSSHVYIYIYICMYKFDYHRHRMYYIPNQHSQESFLFLVELLAEF